MKKTILDFRNALGDVHVGRFEDRLDSSLPFFLPPMCWFRIFLSLVTMLRLSRAALSLLSHGPSGSVAGGFAAVAASGVGVQRMYVHGGRGNSFVVSATPAEKEEDDFHVGSEGEGEGVEESSTFTLWTVHL